MSPDPLSCYTGLSQAIQRSTLIAGEPQALPSSLRSSLKEADLKMLRHRLQQMHEGRAEPPTGGTVLESNGRVGEGSGETGQLRDPRSDSSEGGDDNIEACERIASVAVVAGDDGAWPRRGVAPPGIGVGLEAAESPTRSSASVAAVEHVVRHLQEEGFRRSAEVMSMLGGGVRAHPLEDEVGEDLASGPSRQCSGWAAKGTLAGGSASSLATWFAGVSAAVGRVAPPAGQSKSSLVNDNIAGWR